MSKRVKGALIAGAVVATLGAGGVAIAGATGSGDEAGGDDGSGTPITGNALDRAKAAALQETGGGTVTGTEVRDEEGYYEVEVTRDDGSQVDVHLDRNFNVTDQSADGGSDGGDGPGNN